MELTKEEFVKYASDQTNKIKAEKSDGKEVYKKRVSALNKAIASVQKGIGEGLSKFEVEIFKADAEEKTFDIREAAKGGDGSPDLTPSRGGESSGQGVATNVKGLEKSDDDWPEDLNELKDEGEGDKEDDDEEDDNWD